LNAAYFQLHRLLAQCAHYILGPFGQDCELRRFGERLLDRGGGSKKKVYAAGARKISVLLYSLWKNESNYDPFYKEHKQKVA